MRPITVTVGNQLVAGNAANIRTATTAPAGNLVLNGGTVAGGIATLDIDRNVLFTFAAGEPGLRLQVEGVNFRGNLVSEAVYGPLAPGTILSVNQYFKVTSVVSNQASVGAISIGTSSTGTTPWVAFDPWSPGTIAIQVNATGSVNYTVQSTLDNPNDVTSLNYNNPASVVWVPSSDTVAVGATISIQSNFLFVPQFARVLLNSGTGAVVATFMQSGAS